VVIQYLYQNTSNIQYYTSISVSKYQKRVFQRKLDLKIKEERRWRWNCFIKEDKTGTSSEELEKCLNTTQDLFFILR